MSDVNLPAYARLPNGPCEPNVTPKGVMVVEQPHKMAKTLMKMANQLAKPRPQPQAPRSRPLRSYTRPHKKDVKWY